MTTEERMARIGTRIKQRFLFDGREHSIASNGFAAIVVPRAVDGYVQADKEHTDGYCDLLNHDAPFEATGESLRSFAGPIIPEPDECKECEGTGYIECNECGHGRDCYDCIGSGNMGGAPDREKVTVTVSGMNVSRHLLAEVLAGTADATYRYGKHARESGLCLAVRGDDWIGLIMGLNPIGSPDPIATFAAPVQP